MTALTFPEPAGPLPLSPGIGDGGGGTTNHALLTNRTIADQHTIGAITNLQASLDLLASLSPALLDNNAYVAAEVTVDPRLASQGGSAHGTVALAGTFPVHLVAIDGNVRGRQAFLINKSGTQTINAPSDTLIDSTGATVSSIALTAGQAAICTAYLDTSGPDDIWRVDVLAGGSYQPLDADLTAIAALTTTSYGRALLTTANLAALQAVLGTGTPSATTYLRGDGTWDTPAVDPVVALVGQQTNHLTTTF